MRLIDADALIDNIPQADLNNDKKISKCGAIADMVLLVCDAPTIDAVPVVRGEWIQKHHITSFSNMTLTGTFPTCSLCGYAWLGVAQNTNYCPNCGAKMEDKS